MVLFILWVYLLLGYFVIEVRCAGDNIFCISTKKNIKSYTIEIFLWLPNLVKYLYTITK